MSSEVDILLVEDSADDAELALRSLASTTWAGTVHRVADGAEALEFLWGQGRYEERRGRRPPKVVLLDLNLPKLPGLEVLRRLRAEATTREVPVVALTSSRDERDVAKAYALGANSYIVKPLDYSQLDEALHVVGRYWLVLNEPPRGV